MNEDKRALRQRLRQHPAAGDDQAICGRILEHPWFLEARAVMAYAAIPPEPDLEPVLRAALAAGKILLLPRCGPDGSITARRVERLGDLISGAYGILEPPETAEKFPSQDIQLILTPGMAFAPSGARLGRGMGFYDRFLTGTAARTVGICYADRLLPHVPMERHDRCMDAVITDQRMILCGMEGDA